MRPCTYSLPPVLGFVCLLTDPVLPKDPSLLHKLGNLACYAALTQQLSKIQSSRDMPQFLASECDVLSALKQNVGDSLPSFATVAAWVSDARHPSPEEKVLHPNLFCTHLDVRGALPLTKVLVWL